MFEAIAGLVKQGMSAIGGSGGSVGVAMPKAEGGSQQGGSEGMSSELQKYGDKVRQGAETAKVQGQVPSFVPVQAQVVSDERLKEIFGEETPIDSFAKIHAYEFKYTPQAQEMMQGEDHVDDKEHLGVMAQELLENPATSACVIKDTDGFLKVDTAQLTMANTATIAELSRKIQKLEEMIGER